MYEITCTIDARVESNKQGGRVYKITENLVLENDAAFSSFLKKGVPAGGALGT